jgi:hypothetical protein
MKTQWDAIQIWLTQLSQTPASTIDSPLSPEGRIHALQTALSLLTPHTLKIAMAEATTFRHVTMVVASTVFTAPIEWCAVLLGRGASVTLKVPTQQPTMLDWLVVPAQHLGLPLTVTTQRDAIQSADLVISMGSDDTTKAIKSAISAKSQYLGFGHKFSVAVVTTHDQWQHVAQDATLYDGRGCFSPAAIFTTLPIQEAANALFCALQSTQSKIPRGDISSYEAAAIRSRGALATVTGTCHASATESVHLLPISQFKPYGLPRSIAIYAVDKIEHALDAVRPYASHLSIVGTDNAEAGWLRLGASRVVALGDMQRPPLNRLHDGIDWLKATIR